MVRVVVIARVMVRVMVVTGVRGAVRLTPISAMLLALA
jgi:hypothetical protein